MYVITKRLKDAAIAHRLGMGYEGPCKNIHGHTYHFEIEFAVEELGKYDMAVDFGDIAKIGNDYIQESFDHGFLVCISDFKMIEFLKSEEMKHFITFSDNSTAENIAKLVYNALIESFSDHEIHDFKITVWETDTSKCSYDGGDLDDE